MVLDKMLFSKLIYLSKCIVPEIIKALSFSSSLIIYLKVILWCRPYPFHFSHLRDGSHSNGSGDKKQELFQEKVRNSVFKKLCPLNRIQQCCKPDAE